MTMRASDAVWPSTSTTISLSSAAIVKMTLMIGARTNLLALCFLCAREFEIEFLPQREFGLKSVANLSRDEKIHLCDRQLRQ